MKEKFSPYPYILPAIVFVTLIVLFPCLYSFYLAFTNYSLYHFTSFSFIGLDNFKEILLSAELSTFLSVLWWTFIWASVGVLSQVVVGLAFALVLNKPHLWGKNLYRTLLIIPWAVPSFITVLMWTGLLNTDFGLINKSITGTPILCSFINFMINGVNHLIEALNYLLGIGHLHLETFKMDSRGFVPWLTEGPWAKISVLMVNLWLGFPYMMSISLGALQGIPAELYEASSLDGASKVQQFRRITLPMLRSSMLPVIITSFAFNFNNFVGIYLLTAGGPAVAGSRAGATDILVSYTYKLAFNLSQYGLACAYAVLIFLLIGSISMVNFKLTGAFKE
ncbi:MAG: sugar ABC transporter permease [Candidatus Eremiobacteraeota bacterium]|nr:sugar ABC transporter permease [Candidatus Eremiobacteraeota bacterium]